MVSGYSYVHIFLLQACILVLTLKVICFLGLVDLLLKANKVHIQFQQKLNPNLGRWGGGWVMLSPLLVFPQ